MSDSNRYAAQRSPAMAREPWNAGRRPEANDAVSAGATVGKRTQVEQAYPLAGYAAHGPGVTGGDDLDDLVGEPWYRVHIALSSIWSAATPEAGTRCAERQAAVSGSFFQDQIGRPQHHRPPSWLRALLLAFNQVMSGDHSADAEIRACVSWMPQAEADYVLHLAALPRKPQARARPPKGPAPTVNPGEKRLPGTPGGRPRNATDDRIDAAQRLAASLRVLARTLEASNGFHIAPLTSEVFPDSITPEAARILVEKRLPELEQAIRVARATGNDDELTRVMATDPIPWLVAKWGDGTRLAAHLRGAHKRGELQLEIVGAIGGVVAGPIWGTLFESIVQIVRYASNEQTAAQTITNIVISATTPALARVAGGPSVIAAFRGALLAGLTSLIQQEQKIQSARTAEERTRLEATLIKQVICDAFLGAIRSGVPEGGRRELKIAITELATKLGILVPELAEPEEPESQDPPDP